MFHGCCVVIILHYGFRPFHFTHNSVPVFSSFPLRYMPRYMSVPPAVTCVCHLLTPVCHLLTPACADTDVSRAVTSVLPVDTCVCWHLCVTYWHLCVCHVHLVTLLLCVTSRCFGAAVGVDIFTFVQFTFFRFACDSRKFLCTQIGLGLFNIKNKKATDSLSNVV